jgi:hypothetical protein
MSDEVQIIRTLKEGYVVGEKNFILQRLTDYKL